MNAPAESSELWFAPPEDLDETTLSAEAPRTPAAGGDEVFLALTQALDRMELRHAASSGEILPPVGAESTPRVTPRLEAVRGHNSAPEYDAAPEYDDEPGYEETHLDSANLEDVACEDADLDAEGWAEPPRAEPTAPAWAAGPDAATYVPRIRIPQDTPAWAADPGSARFLDEDPEDGALAESSAEAGFFADAPEAPRDHAPLSAERFEPQTFEADDLGATELDADAFAEPFDDGFDEDLEAALIEDAEPARAAGDPGAALNPAQPAADAAPRREVRSALRAPAQRVVRARVASLGARALAWVVDGAVLSGTLTLLIWMAGRIAGADGGLGFVARDAHLTFYAVALASLIGTTYSAIAVALGGQTLGGWVAGVRILDGRGENPTLGRALVRALAAVPGTLALLVGYAWALVDERGQALHDKLTRTYAVEA